MMAVFFFTAHEHGFKFHAQPHTGAYSCLFIAACSNCPEARFDKVLVPYHKVLVPYDQVPL